MTLRHHSPMRRALRAALVGSMLLLAARSASLADGPGSNKPDQAIVFDGSTAAQDIFTVALKNDGYLVELSAFGFVCPESDHVSPSGIFALFEDAGVFRVEHEIGEILLMPVPRVPGTIPPELEDLETDCDLLGVLPALEAYAASASSLAQTRLIEAQSCRDRVRDLYCVVVAAIEDAPTLDVLFDEPPFLGGNGGFFDFTFLPPQACTRALTRLDEIPKSLDALAALVSLCEGRETALQILHVDVLTRVQSQGGLAPSEKEEFLDIADATLGATEKLVDEVEETVDDLAEAIADLDEDSVEESCDECSPDFIGGSQLLLSGLVELAARRQVVGRFVGAFHSAANHADDPELAARLNEIAERLAEVPNDRVLQALFPSGWAAGQHLLALRPPELPDDGESPLVVVLTAADSAVDTPGFNAADIELLFEQIRLFNATVTREPDRPDTPD